MEIKREHLMSHPKIRISDYIHKIFASTKKSLLFVKCNKNRSDFLNRNILSSFFLTFDFFIFVSLESILLRKY